MKRRALVTGCTGQTGSYLAELLLEKDYQVYGMIRRTSTQNLWRLAGFQHRLELVEGDLLDESSLRRLLTSIRPDEVYNFAAQSHVGTSFVEPTYTSEVTGLGVLRLLEAARNGTPSSRIYQASSSEMFGNPVVQPQDEHTPIQPISPYGCAKAFAHHVAQTYRQAYGMFIACGIAFNHESPRRGEEFVTRKITKAVARIKSGQLHILRLGNYSAKRDWSHAKDMARGAWLTLQHPTPEDFVFASGESHSVQDFAELAFNMLSLNPSEYIKTDASLMRPTDIQLLVGNAGKARRLLRWTPTVTFMELIKEMVDADMAEVGHRDSRASEGSPPPVPLTPLPLAADLPHTSDTCACHHTGQFGGSQGAGDSA